MLRLCYVYRGRAFRGRNRCPVSKVGVGLKKGVKNKKKRNFQQDVYEEFKKSSKRGGVGIKPEGSGLRNLKLWCCRMENEDLYDEVSDQQVEVGQQEELFPESAVAAVALLNVEVPDVPDNLESPSPALR